MRLVISRTINSHCNDLHALLFSGKTDNFIVMLVDNDFKELQIISSVSTQFFLHCLCSMLCIKYILKNILPKITGMATDTSSGDSTFAQPSNSVQIQVSEPVAEAGNESLWRD